MKLDKKLDHFYQSVIEDATGQSEEILTEYQASLAKIYEETKEDYERKAALTLKVETDNLIRQKNKTLSSDALEIRRALKEKQDALKDLLFEEINNKVITFMTTSAYDELLIKQIQAATTFARGDSMTIYLNASDSNKKESLEKQTGVPLTISAMDFMGGIRAVIHEKHILIDYSFTTRLAEEKDNFQF